MSGNHFHSGRVSALVVPALVAVVFLAGVSTRGRAEVYPFASWAMFSNTPYRIDYYTMLVHELDGKAVSPPELVFHLPVFGEKLRNSNSYWRMKEYCDAVSWASRGGADSEQNYLKKRAAAEALLGKHQVKYELLRINCNPLYFYRDGQPNYAMDYGVFETGRPVSMEALRDYHGQKKWPSGMRQE